MNYLLAEDGSKEEEDAKEDLRKEYKVGAH